MKTDSKINNTDKNKFFNSENYKQFKHKSGLTVILNIMPQYSYAYAIIGTKYGSIYNEFKKPGNEKFKRFPEGIAHFLEHKMFENPDGEDSFYKYAKTGAIANAYTGFDQTCYLFSSVKNFKESLKVLINTVTQPYFTKENVEKEQGIISQEIKMCQDDPNWRCYFGVLQGLYHNVQVIYDIAGTEDTIKKITPELLYECYNTFYNLNNMVLSIAGNFDPNDVDEVLDNLLIKSGSFNVENKIYDEPESIVKEETSVNLAIKNSIIEIGFKHKPQEEPRNNFILNIKHTLVNELLIGCTSEIFEDLYYNEIISKHISSEVINGPGYLASIFIVETKEPELVRKKIFDGIEKTKTSGVSNNYIENVKKSFYGNYIMEMNSPKIMATNHMDGFLDGLDYREWQEIIDSVTKEEIEELIKKCYNKKSSTASIVRPIV